MTRIVLVRHGQTEWNREFRFRGRIDVELNETGRAQAEACARRVAARWAPSAVYSSPLSRAVRTAEAIARRCGSHVSIRQHLIDLNFGEWHGLSMKEVHARWPDLLDSWLKDPAAVRPPQGEPLETLRERVLADIRSLARAHEGDTIAVVSHDAVIRVVVLASLDASLSAFFRLAQDTAAISVLEADRSGIAVVAVNDTSHLE